MHELINHELINKIALFSFSLLLVSFFIGPTTSYLFFGMLFLLGLRKPEFLLAALSSLGVFKNLDILMNFPIDLTAFIFGIAIYIALLITFIKSKINKTGIMGILVLMQGLLALFSAQFISEADDLKWWNAGRFLTFNLPLFYLPFLIIHKKNYVPQIRNIILSIYFISVLLLGVALHNLYFGKLTSWHLSALGESYIELAKYISLGIIFLLCCLFYEKIKLSKVVYLILLIVFSAAIILSPSRGVLLSFMLVAILFFLKVLIDQGRSFKKSIFLFFLILLIPTIGFLAFQKAQTVGLYVQRLTGTFESPVRMKYYHDAVESFVNNPLIGSGVGMFSYEHGGEGHFPHNIFLEIAAEYGLLGIIVFGPFLIYLLYLALKLIIIIPLSNILILIPLWFLIIFLDAMVSGSIANNRSIWLFGAIILIVSKSIKRKKCENYGIDQQ